MLHVTSVCTPCCVLLPVVESCCAKFETSQTFKLPTLLAHQCTELLCLLVPRFTEQTHYKKKPNSGCKEVMFTACHSDELELTFTSPNIISTSPKSVWWADWFRSSSVIWIPQKTSLACMMGKLRKEFSSPIAKSTSPGPSDTYFLYTLLPGIMTHFVIARFFEKVQCWEHTCSLNL